MVCASTTAMAERISWYCALFLALMLVLSCCQSSESEFNSRMLQIQRSRMNKPCDEIYVVREGETLHMISEKCGDPYIVEENPHIHDPDDVFPGLVIKITPYKQRAGLLIAIHQGWSDCDMESDCAALVAAIGNSIPDFSELGRVVEDCRDYMGAFGSLHVKHVFREANCVAHRLAHIASHSSIDSFWIDETPSIIEDVLYEDLCHCNRGSDFTSPSPNVTFIH